MAVGKHDYLVLCLTAIYGMRIGEIVDLRVTDIDWKRGVITKRQCKTGGVLCLPITDPIREAILDYAANPPRFC